MAPLLFTSLGLRSAAFGASLWAAGVGIIRAGGDTLFPPGPDPKRQAALFAAGVPISWATIKSLPLVGVPPQHKLAAMAIGSGTAIVLDGVAIERGLYSEDTEVKAKLGPVLLWTVGVGLLMAAL